VVARKVSGLFTAPVIDAEVDGPVPWLATAYVEGPSLADAVSAHGPLPPGSVLALAAGLAEGLNAIHAAGVVHRDLKPANVLLAADGPRVIDFGISRAVEASALTHTGLVVGSPGFMSPEQAEGRPVGPPSDIFSLGAVLAFAATGHGPFGTGSTPALVYRVVHSPPNLDPLPAQIRPLVERCLAKNPAQRPTAAQLLAGAAYPATGWLPEPVTSTFSLDRVGAAMSASLPVTGARQPTGVLAPPVATVLASPPRADQARRRAGRHPWRGRWRPLTAAAILTGLVGAGVTAGVAMTAGSPPARAAQSVRQDSGSAPVQTYPPASDPASASSSPATTVPTSSSATTPAYLPAPSTPPPATMAPPPTSAPPRPSTSPSPSTSSPYSTPPAPAPSTSAPATPAGY
jgi:eukaryotic-like serine/threonine-protein kinase